MEPNLSTVLILAFALFSVQLWILLANWIHVTYVDQDKIIIATW